MFTTSLFLRNTNFILITDVHVSDIVPTLFASLSFFIIVISGCNDPLWPSLSSGRAIATRVPCCYRFGVQLHACSTYHQQSNTMVCREEVSYINRLEDYRLYG